MSFWLENPIELLSGSLFPSTGNTHAQTMNCLTRIVLIIAIILYLLKYKNSFEFLLFNIVIIIILYYSQSMNHQTSIKENFEMRELSSHQFQPLPLNQLPQNQFQPLPLNTYPLPPVNSPHTSYQYPMMPSDLGGYYSSISRVSDSDNITLRRKIKTSPTPTYHIPHALNQGGLHEHVSSYSNRQFMDNEHPRLDPMYIPKPRTQYQRDIYPSDEDNRTGNFRVQSILGGPVREPTRNPVHVSSMQGNMYDSHGDGYQRIQDLRGNNQYYVTNSDPFSGLFAVHSESAHSDMINDKGLLLPIYHRNGTRDTDYINAIADRQTADELYFRDSMIESAASKIAENEYQYYLGPVRY